ncbi:unnamed protein product [Ranitomeya imitator]|uniref:Palmitoyltransferase n=1 Tax=Ranitomeya imitator TaxID=111125 RepID=A0ABN9L358_9NEOB|nr:unnamed protein product [Ranitomeya imitator]
MCVPWRLIECRCRSLAVTSADRIEQDAEWLQDGPVQRAAVLSAGCCRGCRLSLSPRWCCGRITLTCGSCCIVTVEHGLEKAVYLFIFHTVFLLFVWTYWKAIFTLPKQPTKKFLLPYVEKERYDIEERPEVQRQILSEFAKKLPVYTRTGSGAFRFCDRCQVVKPDRCHHCSVCGMCVLKMDHHCPWVNNCIGFSNYKFFLLFLAYAMLYCSYIASTVFKYFLYYWTAELTNNRSKFHVLFLLFVSLMFFISLMFLFGYHCWLVGLNRTTLEAFSAPVFPSGSDKNGFHLGIRRNLEQVFGKRRKLWLIPVFTRVNQWDDDGTDDENSDE